VPLDKRLAADGRGLEEKTINSRVGDLAEALFLAEKHNREEVEMRSVVERKVQQQEARKRDEQLRLLAEKAREEARNLAEDIERAARHEESLLGGTVDTGLGLTVREREQIRRDRAYEREREMRLSRLPPEQRARLADRDISERIALGTAQPEKETLFDQRLFDQSSGVGAGMGGGEDELYNLYDRPLFAGSAMHMIYKPQSQSSRAEKGFSGTEGVAVREGPVQFEKAPEKTNESADPFGVEQFLSEAKRGKRAKNE
jgi:SNW domain-containing protein 1